MSQQLSVKRFLLRRFEFPKYWEQIVETGLTSETLIERLIALFSEYKSDEGEGVCYSIIDDQGNTLLVGGSLEGWIIIRDFEDDGSLVAIGNERSEGYKPFLFPEWSDIARKHLLPPELGVSIVRQWLTSCNLDDRVTWVR